MSASGGGDNLLFFIKTTLEGCSYGSELATAPLLANLHSACRKQKFHHQLNIEGTYKCSPVTSLIVGALNQAKVTMKSSHSL